MKENILNIKPSRTRDFNAGKLKDPKEEGYFQPKSNRSRAENDSVFTTDDEENEIDFEEAESETHEESPFVCNELLPEDLTTLGIFIKKVLARQEYDPDYSVDDEPLPDEVARIATHLGLHIKDVTNESIELSGATEAGYGTSRIYSNSDYFDFLLKIFQENDGVVPHNEDLSDGEAGTTPQATNSDIEITTPTIEVENVQDTVATNTTSTPQSLGLPEDAHAAMDGVREETREQLKNINKLDAEDAGFGPLRGGKLPRKEKVTTIPKRKIRMVGGKEAHGSVPEDAQQAMENAAESTREQLRQFDARFYTEFGISEGELLGIEGFEELPLSQQKLVYENLKEYAAQGTRGALGAVWSGIKSAFGYSNEHVPRQGSKGMKAYGDVLKSLVKTTQLYGPKVHEEDGKLYPDFVGMQFDREHRKEQKEAVDALNHAAHLFARVPTSWQEDGNGIHANNEWKITTFVKEKVLRTESRTRYRAFEEKQQTYEEAKRNFARELEATGVPKGEVVRKLIEVDAQVHAVRSIETNPAVGGMLHDVQDETLLRKIGTKIAQGAIYGGIGAVGRMATAHVLQFVGSPLVAASLAGVRSWNKTAAEQRERDRKARMGTIDGSDGALNIVAASQKVEVDGEMRDIGITHKLEALTTECRELQENLNNAIEKRDDEAISHFQEKLDKKLQSLHARVTYSYDKLKLNRIQFGGKEDFILNQSHFFESLAEAHVFLAEQKTEPGQRISNRLERYLGYREEAISDRRQKEQWKKVAVASSTAAAFSLAGALAVEEYKTGGVTSKLKEWFVRDGSLPRVYEEIEKGESHTGIYGDGRASAHTPTPEKPEAQTGVLSREEPGLPSKYTITKGDTLLKILTEKNPIPNATTGEPMTQNEMLNALSKLSKEDLIRVGVRSGDINRIYANDSLNLEELQKIIQAHQTELPSNGVKEDLGDFRGSEYERDSDVLNKESIIRETEVQIPDVSDTPNGHLNGDVQGSEVDPRITQKARILETYFINKHISSNTWKYVKGIEARTYIAAMTDKIGANRTPGLTEFFNHVRQEPFKLEPTAGESVERFMTRIFRKITVLSEDMSQPPALKKFLKSLDLRSL